MDALLSRSGIKDAKTDITKAEIYVLAEPGTEMPENEVRATIEDDFGYGLRSYEASTVKKWDELGTGQ